MGGDKPVLTEKHGLAAPALWDWDGDGRRELLLDVNGRALMTRPYTKMQEQFAGMGESLPPAGDIKTNPLAVDWDRDGVIDLLVTDSYYVAGSRAVSFFRGVKTQDGLEAAGAVRMPPYGFKGSYDIFSGSGVTWAQPIEAAGGTLPGLYEVGAEVTYQTCKDDICLLPQTETVVARVLVP